VSLSWPLRVAGLVVLAGLFAACSSGTNPVAQPGAHAADAKHAQLRRMSTESTPPVPIPSSGAYFGARVNPSGTSGPSNLESETESLESTLGRDLATDMHYMDWGEITSSRLSEADYQGDLTYGRIPVISWECGDNLTTIAYDLNNNVTTSTDYQTVKTAADAIANFGSPVFVRFFWEFNIDLDNEGKNGDNTNCFTYTAGVTTRAAEATEFKTAWEALVTFFQNQGATNVAWLWNPSYDPSDLGDTASLSQLQTFLPGSSYVDWIGVDAYDKSDIGFDATLSPFYGQFGSAGYPIMVGETGEEQDADGTSTPPPSPGCTQEQYFADATYSISNGTEGSLSTCASTNEGSGVTAFPNVKAFMYFDAQTNPSYDWILADPSNGFTGFSTMASNSYFTPTLASP
jgi:hypothetical protein